MDAVAFALRAEYEGHVDVELEDGSTESRPKYAGGLLAVGDGDFNVGEALTEGDGTIVVYEHDSPLVELLNVYPALKRVPVPDGATPISPYVRKSLDDLQLHASLRDLPQAGSMSKRRLESALLAHDAELAAGVAPAEATAAAVEAASAPVPQGDGDVGADGEGDGSGEIPVDTLSTDQLVAVLDNDTEAYADAGRVEIPAAIDELRSRSDEGDQAATAALEAHDLTKEA